MKGKSIPNCSGFTITEDGFVYGPDGTIKRNFIDKDGYVSVGLKEDGFGWTTVRIDKLLMLAFNPPDEDPSGLVVKHLDDDKTNNFIENLQWITVQQSLESQDSLKSNVPKIFAMKDTGEIEYFSSLDDATIRFGVTGKAAWLSLKDKVHIDPEEQWTLFNYTPPPSKKEEVEEGSIICRNVYNDTEMVFKSLALAARYHGVSVEQLEKYISTKNELKVFRDLWAFHTPDEDISALTPKFRKSRPRRGPKPVFVYHVPSGQKIIFESATQLIDEYDLSRRAVTARLLKRKLDEVDGFLFTYLSDTELIKKLKEQHGIA